MTSRTTPLSLSLALLATVACLSAQTPDSGIYTRQYENVLGTSLEMKFRAPNAATADRAEAAALAEIDRENAILSAWQPTSEFSRWIKTRNTPVHVSPELLDVLSLFDAWRQQTGGALDASAETAVRVWKTAEADHRQPTSEELAAAVKSMQQPHWTVDRAAGTATHLDDAPIALNSFAKSYITGHAASAALAAGATGVSLNMGGDIVLTGQMTQRIAVANPRADAENDPPLDTIQVGNRTVATSGAYRRGVDINGRHYSHIIDPRTGQTAESILSSTVIAPDSSEAGALATAFSVMSPAQSKALAARLRNVDYLLVTASGQTIASPGWAKLEVAHAQPASYSLPRQKRPATAAPAQPHMDLLVSLELASPDSPRFHRPYVAVWVEDQNHKTIKTLALWAAKPRWLNELRTYYHDADLAGRDITALVSLTSATRSAGKYSLRWNGLDEAGKPVPPGKYTVFIEAAREHGTYGIMRQEIDFDGRKPQQFTLPGNTEIAGAALDYGAHEQ
jgi:thiamine biosynthesis lipoprotein ApbE